MKLSKRTQGILKNFASINQSIVIKPGNNIQTISNTKDVFAKAEIEETFEQQIAIYDLNEFLSVLTVFEDPELNFEDNSVIITEGRSKQIYRYADASIITQPPEKGLNLPSVEVEAKLSREAISSLIKASSLNDATSLSFQNGNVKVWNSSVANSNVFEIEGVATHEVDYELSIGVDKLKFVSDDYVIKLCAKGLAQFVGTQKIEYFVALQPNGKYGS